MICQYTQIKFVMLQFSFFKLFLGPFVINIFKNISLNGHFFVTVLLSSF